MASETNTKINETLYTDSYFRLLRSKNNISEAEDEFRRLIMQTDMHCSTLNMSKQNSDDLKSQLIFEYSSIIDNKNEDGLLPVINDDFDNEKWLNSSVKNNCDIALNKAKQYCMENIQKRLTSLNINFSNEKSKSSSFASSSFDSKNNSGSYNLQSLHNLEPKKSICMNKGSFNNKQSIIVNIDNKYSNNCESDNSSKHKASIQHFKHSDSMSPGIALKRRAVEEIDNSTSFSSKRSNNRINYSNKTEEPPENLNKIKNTFMTASSMYKNPLKKACKKKENLIESEVFDNDSESDIKNHPTLKNFDPKIVTIILSEIMDFSPDIKWSDIAGLEFVKNTVQEIVIWPLLRPDIFTGLRAPPKGILLFGPPGTGKTLIGKCIATESNSTFFCISASSLASKWVGESEQLVRALFAVAQLHQPAVIFIDEIDSLLSQRSDQEQDHTRKLKTEFLVQFDGAKTISERRILVVGATNRPHELDEAARRRFVKRLYVPLPVEDARLQIIEKLLSAHQHNLSTLDLKNICEETKGYSGSDVAHLCKEAAMGPIRSIGPEHIKTVSLDQVRPIELIDFLDALKQVRASVAEEDLNYYLDWNKKFGSFSA